MKLEFESIEETIKFLRSIGYCVKKEEEVQQEQEKESTSKEDDILQIKDEDFWKKISTPVLPYNPYPYNPYAPYYPSVTNPIVTWEAMTDPNFSKKIECCKKR